MKKYEYKFINLRLNGMTEMTLTSKHEKEINDLGKDGWILDQMIQLKAARNIIATMRRELKE